MAAAVEDDAEGLGGIPPDYVYPITQELVRDPVTTINGHSYERDAIVQWFAGGRPNAP